MKQNKMIHTSSNDYIMTKAAICISLMYSSSFDDENMSGNKYIRVEIHNNNTNTYIRLGMYCNNT